MSRKAVIFVGDALAELKNFPERAKKEAGSQLYRVQLGLEPANWKPMTSIGPGVREIRIRDSKGAFRVIYLAQRKNFVFALKQNPRGRFLRITEDVGGRRDTIIIPSTGLAEFKKIVDEMVKISEETPEKQPDPMG